MLVSIVQIVVRALTPTVFGVLPFNDQRTLSYICEKLR